MKRMNLCIPKSKDCFILLDDAYITSDHHELNNYLKKEKESNVLVQSGFSELSNSSYTELKEIDRLARIELSETSKGKIKIPKGTKLRFNTMFTLSMDVCSVDILTSSIFTKQIKTIRISIDDLNTFVVDRFEYVTKAKVISNFDIKWRYTEKDVKKIQLSNHQDTRFMGFSTHTKNLDDKNFILTFDMGSVQISYDFKNVNRKKFDNGDYFNLDMKDWLIRSSGGNHYSMEIAKINLICRCESFITEREKFGQIEHLAAIKVIDINYEVLALPVINNKIEISKDRFNDKFNFIGAAKTRDKVRDIIKKHYSFIEAL